jgi:hypothetical protein
MFFKSVGGAKNSRLSQVSLDTFLNAIFHDARLTREASK